MLFPQRIKKGNRFYFVLVSEINEPVNVRQTLLLGAYSQSTVKNHLAGEAANKSHILLDFCHSDCQRHVNSDVMVKWALGAMLGETMVPCDMSLSITERGSEGLEGFCVLFILGCR